MSRPFGRRIARGKKKEKGEMNRLEAEYARHLEGLRIAGDVEWWRFEPAKFYIVEKDKLTGYTPDFMVMLSNCDLEIHETKGWMEDDANVKIKVFADQYPFRVRLVKKTTKAERDKDPLLGNWRIKEV